MDENKEGPPEQEKTDGTKDGQAEPSTQAQLHAVPGKLGRQGQLRPRNTRFRRGNKVSTTAAQRRRLPTHVPKAKDLFEDLGRFARETLYRTRTREVVEQKADPETGEIKKKWKPLDAARANAITNILRFLLELDQVHKRGEEMRQLQVELDSMRETVMRLVVERGR